MTPQLVAKRVKAGWPLALAINALEPYTGTNRYPREPPRFRGISWDRGLWKARVQYQGSIYNLGRHETQEDAAIACDVAAKILFGPDANLNFPGAPEPYVPLHQTNLSLQGLVPGRRVAAKRASQEWRQGRQEQAD